MGGTSVFTGEALIVSLLYKPDAQARESSNAVAHPSLARRACMSSLLAFRKLPIEAHWRSAGDPRLRSELATGFRNAVDVELQFGEQLLAIAVFDKPIGNPAAPQSARIDPRCVGRF
jgi:hypothetical protein